MSSMFTLYSKIPNGKLDEILRGADYVIVEAGFSAILIERIHKLNSDCKIVYYVTDLSQTVGGHPKVDMAFREYAKFVDHIIVRSPRMASQFECSSKKIYRAEFGIDYDQYADVGSSPYPNGSVNAVSVGSMLFDADFVLEAARQFPDVQFHVIGCGMTFNAPGNVTIHPEMPFVDTLPYVKHATVGFAPYRPAPGVEYLADSSLKLAQYEFFGLPAVCPEFAVGDVKSRFGYTPRNRSSIANAMRDALAHSGKIEPKTFLTWEEVGERILAPEKYPETRV